MDIVQAVVPETGVRRIGEACLTAWLGLPVNSPRSHVLRKMRQRAGILHVQANAVNEGVRGKVPRSSITC